MFDIQKPENTLSLLPWKILVQPIKRIDLGLFDVVFYVAGALSFDTSASCRFTFGCFVFQIR